MVRFIIAINNNNSKNINEKKRFLEAMYMLFSF